VILKRSLDGRILEWLLWFFAAVIEQVAVVHAIIMTQVQRIVRNSIRKEHMEDSCSYECAIATIISIGTAMA